MPFASRIALAIVVTIAVGFAALYWNAAQTSRELLQRKNDVEDALAQRQAAMGPDALQIERQLADYRLAFESTQSAALRGLEWAANQTSQYAFNEMPLDDFRLSIVAELASRLAELDFNGFVRLETHVGNFCMSSSADAGFILPVEDIPVLQCDQVGFEPAVAYEMGLQQSVAFANFINQADERDGGNIRYEIVSLGNSRPLLAYPSLAVGVSASDWNRIAASNNRVEIAIFSAEP